MSSWLDEYIGRADAGAAADSDDPISAYMALGEPTSASTREERAAKAAERLSGGPYSQNVPVSAFDSPDRSALADMRPASLEESFREKAAPWLLPVAKGALAASAGTAGAVLSPLLLPAGAGAAAVGGTALLGGLGGSLLGGAATEAIAEKSAGRDLDQELALARQEGVESHPFGYRAAELLPLVAAGNFPGAGKDLLGRTVGAGLGGSMEAAFPLLRGEAPDPLDVLFGIGSGAALNKTFRQGSKVRTRGGNDIPPPTAEESTPIEFGPAYDPSRGVAEAAAAYRAQTQPDLPIKFDGPAYDPLAQVADAAEAFRAEAPDPNVAKGPFIVPESFNPLAGISDAAGKYVSETSQRPPEKSTAPAYDPLAEVAANADRLRQSRGLPPIPDSPVAAAQKDIQRTLLGDEAPASGQDGNPLGDLLGAAREANVETETLRSAERADRASALEAAFRERGAAGADDASSILAGALPRADFAPARPDFPPEAVNKLREHLAKTSALKPYERNNAIKAFDRMMDPANKVAPRNHELEYFERANLATKMREMMSEPNEPTLREALEPGVLLPGLKKDGDTLGAGGGGFSALEWSKTARAQAIRRGIVKALGQRVTASAAKTYLVEAGYNPETAERYSRALFEAPKSKISPRPAISGGPDERTGGQKAMDVVMNLSGLTRSIPTSLADESMLGRQMAYAKGTKAYWTKLPEKMKSFVSREAYEKINDYTFNRPTAKRWIDAGMEFVPDVAKERGSFREALARTSNADLSKLPEGMQSTLAETIPGIGVGVRASQRAMASMINAFRMDYADYAYNLLASEGINVDKKAMEGIVRAAETLSGAGRLPKTPVNFAQASPLLNTAFYSARLFKSRVDLLVNPLFYLSLPRPVAKSVAKSVLGSIGLNAGIIAAFATMRNSMSKDEQKKYGLTHPIETDLRSPEAGKIRIGNTRFDMWGGGQQLARFLTQFARGTRKSSSGNVYELSGKSPLNPTRGDITARFARSKLAPVPQGVAMALTGRAFDGRPADARAYLELFIPMMAGDIGEAAQNTGPWILPLAAPMSFIGNGVQSYQVGGDLGLIEAKLRAGEIQPWEAKIQTAKLKDAGVVTQRQINGMERRLKSTEEYSRLAQLSSSDLELTLKDMGPQAQQKYAPLAELKKLRTASREYSEAKTGGVQTALQKNEQRAIRKRIRQLEQKMIEQFRSDYSGDEE